MKCDIKDKRLAAQGKLRIEWAARQMGVLKLICERFKREKPFARIRISSCLHVTSETANLLLALKDGGAKVMLCASNPLSTQDDVAASLAEHHGISVFAKRGEDTKTYYRHIENVLDQEPNITMDDGADLVSCIHKKRRNLVKEILAGTEETTTGVTRLRSLEKQRLLLYPIFAINDANTKSLFDNRYGTGQSTIDGILRATNQLLAGANFVVCGYGWCGKGLAMRARGMGSNVVVIETNPLRALEAVMDGYTVTTLKEACRLGDIFVTITGNTSVIREEHFRIMKDGVIVANSGHFNVEIDIGALERLSKKKRQLRSLIDEYTLRDGRRINLLAEGRLINLAAAEGHPSSVMDMSFANQALVCEYITKNYNTLSDIVYKVPKPIDEEVARLKLQCIGVKIDTLTKQQKKYIESWELGT